MTLGWYPRPGADRRNASHEPTGDAVGSIVVFVIVGSLTIAVPVVYYFLGGEHAKTELDKMKSWLAVHNAAVMIVLFVVFGVDLIAKGLSPLTT
ncbi:MAG: GAP family protein [Gaiellaceae bacterium]